MDNRIFNVNGSGKEMLAAALDLAFKQDSYSKTCSAFSETKDSGLILLWCKGQGQNDLPADLDSAACVDFVLKWLVSDFAKEVKLSKWCENHDHDGHNSDGWQVYCEDWGHVGGNHYSICAIKPAFMWHGK